MDPVRMTVVCSWGTGIEGICSGLLQGRWQRGLALVNGVPVENLDRQTLMSILGGRSTLIQQTSSSAPGGSSRPQGDAEVAHESVDLCPSAGHHTTTLYSTWTFVPVYNSLTYSCILLREEGFTLCFQFSVGIEM